MIKYNENEIKIEVNYEIKTTIDTYKLEIDFDTILPTDWRTMGLYYQKFRPSIGAIGNAAIYLIYEGCTTNVKFNDYDNNKKYINNTIEYLNFHLYNQYFKIGFYLISCNLVHNISNKACFLIFNMMPFFI